MTATTDITGLRAALDANPADRTLRKVLADALEEQEGGCWDGLRALAACGAVPRWNPHFYHSDSHPGCWELWSPAAADDPVLVGHILPADWFALLTGCPYPRVSAGGTEPPLSMDYRTRHDTEEDAAAAFLRLPAERRAQLLRGEP